MSTEIDTIALDNAAKLERFYNGRKLRHYIQLLEIAETICRSSKIGDKAKIVAKGFADHYRRMVLCIAMKPFNPDQIDDLSMLEIEKAYTAEVRRLHSLLDSKF